MSLIANRPPGFSIRAISRKTAGLSGARLMTQLEITQSTVASDSGSLSIVARWYSIFISPDLSALARARSIISGVMSMPIALPSGPTLRAASSTSRPPPLPRSTITSPLRKLAKAVGLPQESPMFASGGIEASSSGVYPNASATAFTPSRLLDSPLVATEPYFDFTAWVIRSDIIVLLIGSRGLLVQTVPHLHHHAEHEPADVVPPLSIFQGFVGAVVVDLRIQVGHRDAGGGSLDQRASGIGIAADHEGGKSLLWVAGVEVGLGELGRLHARAPPDYEGRIGGLRLASGSLLTGRLNLHADVLEGGDGAWVEGGGSRPATVEADLGHPVVGRGDVAHGRPQDAATAVPGTDQGHVKGLTRLVVPGDPVHQPVAGLAVRLVDHVERGRQQVDVRRESWEKPFA